MSEEEVIKLDGPAFMAVLNGLLSKKLERQRLAQEETERAQRAEAERIEAEKKAIEDKRLAEEREQFALRFLANERRLKPLFRLT